MVENNNTVEERTPRQSFLTQEERYNGTREMDG
jgi:hypothetical protein